MDRLPVTVPLQSGTKLIDALIPVGRGQRELTLGHRQTGMTAISLDAIVTRRGKNVLRGYCAAGRRSFSVAKDVRNVCERAATDHTIILVASGEAPRRTFSCKNGMSRRGRTTVRSYQNQRQASVTGELMDIVSGF